MVRLATVNVNGLVRYSEKVVDLLNNSNIDILCIQETHLVSDEYKNKIEKETKGILFLNQAQWSGSAVLIRNFLTNIKIDHLKINDPVIQNRVTHLRIHSDSNIDIISVYANANNEYKIEFYEHFKTYINKYKIIQSF